MPVQVIRYPQAELRNCKRCSLFASRSKSAASLWTFNLIWSRYIRGSHYDAKKELRTFFPVRMLRRSSECRRSLSFRLSLCFFFLSFLRSWSLLGRLECSPLRDGERDLCLRRCLDDEARWLSPDSDEDEEDEDEIERDRERRLRWQRAQ